VDELVPERVWQETARALMYDKPSTFLATLHECGALARVMPEIAALFGVPQRADYHPEVDTGIHTLMCVDAAAAMKAPLEVRAAAMLHDLGKAKTPKNEWPKHHGHDARGVPLVERLCERLRVPSASRDLAVIVTREHLVIHLARELRPGTLLELLERMDAIRRPERFELALAACVCDRRGRTGHEHDEYAAVAALREARNVAASVSAKKIMEEGFTDAALGAELRARQLRALTDLKQAWEPPA
jgi:tRNA nucleotidyltransferase (CCA-adding enzyme)